MTFQARLSQIRHYELPILLMATLGAMASQPLLIVVVSLAILLRLIDFFGKPQSRWSVATPIDLAVVGLCLTLPITWWVTIDGATTGWQILRLLNGIGLFYAAIRWFADAVSVAKLYRLVLTFEAIGAVVVVMGLVSTKWPVGKSRAFDLIYTYLVNFSTGSIHPNVLAGTLLLFLPIPIVFMLLPWLIQQHSQKYHFFALLYGKGWQLWHSAMSLLLFGCLVLTQSRGALLGFSAATIVIAFSLGGKKVRALLLGSTLVAALLSGLFPHYFSTLLSQITSDSAVSTGAVRLEIWSRAYYMIQDFPFTGIGMGNFQQLLELMYPLFLTSEIIPHAHNLFLQIATDLGLIGLISWLAIVIVVMASLLLVIKQEAGQLAQAHGLLRKLLATALLGSQVALLTHGLVDAVTWSGVRTAPLVWLLWGTAVALNLDHTKAEQHSI